MCSCQRHDLLAAVKDRSVVDDLQRVQTCLGERLECDVQRTQGSQFPGYNGHTNRAGQSAHFVKENGIRRVRWVVQHGDRLRLRHQCQQDFKYLGRDVLCQVGDPSGVAAWPGQARNQVRADWIVYCRHDDWYGRGGTLRRTHRSDCGRHDDVWVLAHDFVRELWKTVVIPVCPSHVDRVVAALGHAVIAQTLLERI
jgi:hypothetical protein